ncbi:hypothetical protein PENARI_c005G04738 [Penicillium arizonense]|uniref:RRM domain-containing protein n=1 Tax=Penicillium arizonense TaxID=1835702 RepID=A0A1F5LNV2_PENAI|nr:hypothetical protein PENARI_c005G04738 [Penicillium arizonense]OGE54805.1 hypothetical protein PENARI_c005G04738 [Penicillium arizonense]
MSMRSPRGPSPQRSLEQDRARSRSHSIVVEKLTKNVTENHIREIFGDFGDIEYLDLPINKAFMTNRGTAYILYYDPADAEAAIAHMHEAQLDGAILNASSLRQGDMEVDGLRNVMMSTDQGLYLGHDPPFVLGRTLLDHGLPYPDEVVFAQTRATAGAVAQVTAVMVTAVVAAVQPEAVAETATEHPMVQNIMSLSSWSVVPWCENLPSLLGLLLQATECLPQNIHNQCIKIKKETEATEQHLNE